MRGRKWPTVRGRKWPTVRGLKWPTVRGLGRLSSVAALLSFLWPGLGQLYTRNRRLAAIFAVPPALVLFLLVWELRRGPVVFALRFAESSVSLAALLIVILLGALRLASVIQAFASGVRIETRRRPDRAVLAALSAVIVISHVAVGSLLLLTFNAGSHTFSPISPLIDLATPVTSLAPGETPGPTATPVVTPSINDRVTILFTGVDSNPGREETLYDSIMVVSYDPKTNSVQMVSVPRDTAGFPMYFGNHPMVAASTRINSVPGYVHNGWILSPDAPYTTLVKEVSFLVGIPIHYYAVMDLAGFVKMIDKVGGIDIVNPSDIVDVANPSLDWPGYDWLDGTYGFILSAGPQHLDGRHALAYVRARKGNAGGDFARAGRQQQVLIALLHKMAEPSEILALPELVTTLSSSVTTNFPAGQVADYVDIGQNVPSDNFHQVVLSVPDYAYYMTNGGTCMLYGKVAAESVKLFGSDSTWSGKPAPAFSCP
jgi:LCP family protein required for cell wall assembly